uniref:N-acetylglucosaminylphosphatidylinositol deacetylase n=1 Tax=Leptobrachium leishanense TaxID=445787 RepID=A0A8C5QWF7_9ANUR
MLATVLLVGSLLLWWACSRWRDALSERAPVLPCTARAALLLIAHPDDECMFFAPTILGLLREQRQLHVLCFSTGNYYNQGEIRKNELIHSCTALGIPPSNVTDLPDNPNVQWNTDLLSDLILNHIKEKKIDTVPLHTHHNITMSIFLVEVIHAGSVFIGCGVLVLETVNVFRKYLSLLDLPGSWLYPKDVLFTVSGAQYSQAKEAMKCHQSQLLWFRRIYLLFSRYMMINSLALLTCEKEEKALKAS